MEEDWPILLSFFPDNWINLASETDALKGLRKDKDAENYIRMLLIHIACGYSLRETATRAKQADIADISDVALLGRLRKAKDWLHKMCIALFEEQEIAQNIESDFQVRLFDATTVKEPGKTGGLWRIHYSIKLPVIACDFFKITATKGRGTGESFFQYSIRKNDYIIADRGYSTASGIHHIASKKAYVIVRVNTSSLPMLDIKSQPFQLLKNATDIKRSGVVRSWPVLISRDNSPVVKGKVCVIRKTEEAIKIAHKKLIRTAQRKGNSIKPETFEYAKYVIVFTTFPENSFTDIDILEWYRVRWQVELLFKRFKSIAQLGHLPKHGGDSSEAWLYGKLFVALLTEKIINYATSISPWGYFLEKHTAS